VESLLYSEKFRSTNETLTLHNSFVDLTGRYWACSNLEADSSHLAGADRRALDIEVLFGESKEALGLNHAQLMRATALLRFWTPAMLASIFLEEERERLQQHCQHPVTIGQARRDIPRRHCRTVLHWLHGPFLSGVQPDSLSELFAA
jgi:hypothetical protein